MQKSCEQKLAKQSEPRGTLHLQQQNKYVSLVTCLVLHLMRFQLLQTLGCGHFSQRWYSFSSCLSSLTVYFIWKLLTEFTTVLMLSPSTVFSFYSLYFIYVYCSYALVCCSLHPWFSRCKKAAYVRTMI